MELCLRCGGRGWVAGDECSRCVGEGWRPAVLTPSPRRVPLHVVERAVPRLLRIVLDAGIRADAEHAARSLARALAAHVPTLEQVARQARVDLATARELVATWADVLTEESRRAPALRREAARIGELTALHAEAAE